MEASVQTALGWAQIAPALPELILAGSALVLLMVGVFRDERTSADIVTWGALIALALSGYAILGQPAGEQMAFGGAFVVDGFARFAKLLTLVAAGIVLFMASDSLREASIHKFEFPVLVLLATTGMLMMISAHSLIGLYVGLELQSLALYVIAAFRRDSVRSSEAGLKYFVLGALSSGLLLYGASLVYGFAGTVTFDGIAKAVGTGQVSLGLIFGLVFVLAGLAFKISAVPFHMWTPDVYEGAPTPVTAFFAGAPKVAALALLARVLLEAFPGIAIQWQQVITFIAIGSMVLGAFAAIGQNNIKRLMAYSSIGHVGFALVGIAAGSPDGVKGLLIYLVIYVAMTVGTFACIMAMRRADGPVEDISALSGLARNDLPTAFLLAMLLFSLAGIPPLAGFFAKFYVFLAAIREGLYPLAVIGVLASVVSAYYYLRIIKVMFFDAPADVFEPMPGRLRLVLTSASLFVLFYVVYPAPLVSAAESAARTLFP